MRGLLKAYLDKPINADINESIKSRYNNRPKRLGITIAYGEIPDEAKSLEGQLLRIRSKWLVHGEKTTFLTCELISREGLDLFSRIRRSLPITDQVLKLRRILLPIPKPFHITLGWIERSYPAQAGDECATFWSGMNAQEYPPLPSALCEKTFEATIEFQNFEAA